MAAFYESFRNALHPTTWGSGGGSGYSWNAPGGAGGGSVRLNVTGTIYMSGPSTVSANGENTYSEGGGGAGGSVWVICKSLRSSSSASAIQANGGVGGNSSSSPNKWGGSGGGGRVAVYASDQRNYYGTIEAKAGTATTSVLVSASGYHMGTIFTNSSLITKLLWKDDMKSRNGSYLIDVCFNTSRRGPVQVIDSYGTGNGTRSSTATNLTAVVRGMWRVSRMRSSCSHDMMTLVVVAKATSITANPDTFAVLQLTVGGL